MKRLIKPNIFNRKPLLPMPNQMIHHYNVTNVIYHYWMLIIKKITQNGHMFIEL